MTDNNEMVAALQHEVARLIAEKTEALGELRYADRIISVLQNEMTTKQKSRAGEKLADVPGEGLVRYHERQAVLNGATPASGASEPIGYVSESVIKHALSQGHGVSAYIQAGKPTAEFPVPIYAASVSLSEPSPFRDNSVGAQAAGEAWKQPMRDLVRVLRDVSNGKDEAWALIANVCANAEEMLAAPVPAPATVPEGWRPIETAPKGAKGVAWMLLAWGPEGDQSVGDGMRIGDKFYASGTFYRMDQEKKLEFREIEVLPTHWMPIPPAPAAEGVPATSQAQAVDRDWGGRGIGFRTQEEFEQMLDNLYETTEDGAITNRKSELAQRALAAVRAAPTLSSAGQAEQVDSKTIYQWYAAYCEQAEQLKAVDGAIQRYEKLAKELRAAARVAAAPAAQAAEAVDKLELWDAIHQYVSDYGDQFREPPTAGAKKRCDESRDELDAVINRLFAIPAAVPQDETKGDQQ